MTFENIKSKNVAMWLFEEMTTDRFLYEIFLHYNPNYPDKIDRYMNELIHK